ncbi:hypothetical protein QBC40DRAFT_268808 [Triangularia verruculosa]|uniref:Protein kinase domain-containing protein n=1 Tax=Triangularia verruculosa TaxID=2587418 RepID=A0AAN7AQX3_9PEZI|nr:hypothetical protein QBC40DRAFT_268808 [Triangularia verruculosa]
MAIPWDSLKLVFHAHENISIVQIGGLADDETLFVFKALMEETHYMYHELRLLLSMKSHPNIIARPHGLVMKSRQGDSEPGIVGFLLQLYPGPTLQRKLQIAGPTITMAEKLSWSRQLASALIHLRTQGPGYFPDFKPNNIVFAEPSAANELHHTPTSSVTRPILLDFEQRGTWYTWAPPEVRYIEYLELLALTSGEGQIRQRYTALLKQNFPHWSPEPGFLKRSISNARDGYNFAWTSLTEEGRAKAQMYAFGKVLWCIFEGVPSPDGPRRVESFLEDFQQNQNFPEFQASPPAIQQLIRRCTAGALDWGSQNSGVVRDGDRIVPWGREACAHVTAAEAQDAATQWWQNELALAEEFVQYQYGSRNGREDIVVPEHVAQLRRDIQKRPSLEEVVNVLLALEAQHETT